MLKQSAALVRRHVVELRQAVPHGLLRLRGKIAKARLIRKSALLIGKWKVTMAIHPLGQMLLLLTLARPPRSQSGARPEFRSTCPPLLARRHSRTQAQQQGSKRWLETTPEFGWKTHDVQVVEPVCPW